MGTLCAGRHSLYSAHHDCHGGGPGVRPSRRYTFFIILSPVGAYYPEGFNPVKIFVTDKYVRAVRGGVGEAKTAGNYAASIMAAIEAQKRVYPGPLA